MQEMEYVENNPQRGKLIDWKKVKREYNRVLDEVVPNISDRALFDWEFYEPRTTWELTMSERAIGKTTKNLLIGIIIWKMYGLKMEYIRNKADQIKPSNSGKMWDTILEFGYLDAIFDGEYNDIKYSYKGWYLRKVDENGKEEYVNEHELCHMHCLSNVDNTKSVYNSNSVWLIYDEFIPVDGYTSENMFIELCQTLSTIIRFRKAYINCLSNTVNPNTHIFHELGIEREIRKLKRGERLTVRNSENMPITVTWRALDKSISDKKRNILLETFNFKNPKLASITGGDTWEIKNYKHLPKLTDHIRKLSKMRIYVQYYGDVLQLRLYQSNILNNYIYIHRATEGINRKDNNYIIFTNVELTDKHTFFGLQFDIGNYILDKYYAQEIYYAYNDDGQLFEEFLKDCKLINRYDD